MGDKCLASIGSKFAQASTDSSSLADASPNRPNISHNRIEVSLNSRRPHAGLVVTRGVRDGAIVGRQCLRAGASPRDLGEVQGAARCLMPDALLATGPSRCDDGPPCRRAAPPAPARGAPAKILVLTAVIQVRPSPNESRLPRFGRSKPSQVWPTPVVRRGSLFVFRNVLCICQRVEVQGWWF